MNAYGTAKSGALVQMTSFSQAPARDPPQADVIPIP